MQALFALQRFTQMQYLSKVIFKIIERFFAGTKCTVIIRK